MFAWLEIKLVRYACNETIHVPWVIKPLFHSAYFQFKHIHSITGHSLMNALRWRFGKHCKLNNAWTSCFRLRCWTTYNSSAMRQKGESQNECYKKTKHTKFSQIFGKFDVLCFLLTPVLRFALLPYCRRINEQRYFLLWKSLSL